MSHYFLITSNGNNASRWLARALNLHPEIVCSHSPAGFPLCMRHEREYTNTDFQQVLAEEVRKKMSADDLLEEIESYSTGLCFGNVHHFNLRQLSENQLANPTSKNLKIFDLLRHPVAVVNSGTQNMARQARFNPDRLKYLTAVFERNRTEYCGFIEQNSQDFGRTDVLAFFASVMVLKSLEINLNLELNAERILMEEVTVDPAKLSDLICSIGDEQLVCTQKYLDNVYSLSRINAHARTPKQTVLKTYHSWEKWQKRLFSRVAQETGIEKLYSQFGYDFSFVEFDSFD